MQTTNKDRFYLIHFYPDNRKVSFTHFILLESNLKAFSEDLFFGHSNLATLDFCLDDDDLEFEFYLEDAVIDFSALPMSMDSNLSPSTLKPSNLTMKFRIHSESTEFQMKIPFGSQGEIITETPSHQYEINYLANEIIIGVTKKPSNS